MDDPIRSHAGAIPPRRPFSLRRRGLIFLALFSMVSTLGGCSLFVMAGKMVFGDPTQDAPFKTVTRVDLTKGEHEVLVIATTPQSVKQNMGSADLVIIEQVSRLLKTRGVSIYPSKKVLNWVDDRGGHWGSAHDIASAFPDVDYIIQIDIDQMTHREENSPDLFRGNVSGNIRAFEVAEIAGTRSASPVFSRTFKSTYPTLHPKQENRISERTFQKEFLDRVCTQIAQTFYDYPIREAIQ